MFPTAVARFNDQSGNQHGTKNITGHSKMLHTYWLLLVTRNQNEEFSLNTYEYTALHDPTGSMKHVYENAIDRRYP